MMYSTTTTTTTTLMWPVTNAGHAWSSPTRAAPALFPSGDAERTLDFVLTTLPLPLPLPPPAPHTPQASNTVPPARPYLPNTATPDGRGCR